MGVQTAPPTTSITFSLFVLFIRRSAELTKSSLAASDCGGRSHAVSLPAEVLVTSSSAFSATPDRSAVLYVAGCCTGLCSSRRYPVRWVFASVWLWFCPQGRSLTAFGFSKGRNTNWASGPADLKLLLILGAPNACFKMRVCDKSPL